LRKLLKRHIVHMIVLSIMFTIAAELCFTLYTHLHGVQLVAGHLFKLFSYWVIFSAIVQTALKEPYEIMARTSGSYDAIPTPTLVVNRDGLIQQVNREACRAADMQAIDLLEQDCHDVFHSKRVAKNDCAVCQCITSGKALHDHEMQKQDASWWTFALSPFDAQQNCDLMVHVCSDISDRKHAEQSLIHQANYDSLTQLPNREMVMDRLKQAIERAKRDDKHVAVMFIDMDNFKNINDTLGHLVGDRVLVAVSNVLKATICASDTLARWGGDEFIVILGELDSLSMARPVADKILRHLSSPVHADSREFTISASIGISGFPENSDDPGILLRNADAAMYLAKDAGRNTVRYYTADINAQAVARLEMEGHLRHAIEMDELSLHYQPQVRMRDKKLIGAEALLRWSNPILGNVPPDVFIPLAESSGLIGSIGEWVLRRACEDLAAWQQTGHKDLRVAVNISSLQFVSEGFIPLLQQIVDQYGISPGRLELEITESLLLGDEQRNLELLKHLRALGFNLSLDDFGTGYASVSYLKKFPFSEIKIDRQFVTDADTNESDASLCRAIISMAHVLGLSIVAEGVETRGQWELLRAGNVEIAQGYLYSKPLPEAEFRAFLEREAKEGVVTMPRRRV
jgi:diguanylate cyclase (GGDEF)-like protein/PAS domain S-box-containing protein